MFIAFEGMDGSGKSTISSKVAEYLTKQGKDVLWTREPNEPYRSIILDPNISDEEELLLFMADRARHINNIVRPAINKGQIVITDRYYLSTIAYQLVGKDKLNDFYLVHNLHNWITKDLAKPTFTFVLTIDPETALARATDKNKFEARGLEYFKKIAKFYNSQSSLYSDAYYINTAINSVDQTLETIISVLEHRLKD